LMERLFAAGALDVFFTPIQMKKNRPGLLVRVLCAPCDEATCTGILFTETPTLGVRRLSYTRTALPREFRTVETPFGPVRLKVSRWGDIERAEPEYEDCRKLAEAQGVPLLTVYQSARAARHAEVAHAMLAAGRAYRCYLSPEELTAMRAQAVAEGKSFKVVSPWRDRDPSEAPEGVAPVIRLRAPRKGETMVHDMVQGEVKVANAEMDDLIILRADGTPTYLHAVVVDDHDMAITHVIRGDDHLTNTFRQVQIYQANGWARPRFAHIPLIHGPDGAKLSKRHGAQSVTEFRDMGYLPEGLCNYLLRLGWAHGDDEILSREQAIALFDLDGVGRGAARMDYAKLAYVNGVWLRQADDTWLTDQVLQRLGAEASFAPRLVALMPQLKERAKTLAELADTARFLIAPLEPDAKALALLTDDNKTLLADLLPMLADCDFSLDGVDAALRGFVAAYGRKLGDIAQPLRAALTGRIASPPIDATLAALGRDEALARITKASQ